jgi:hypothetical protein
LRPVFTELADLSANALSRELNRRGVPTTTGKPWSAVMVIRVRKRLEGDGYQLAEGVMAALPTA